MKRLIQKGLMFGNLFHVASPALVERYNRALEHLTEDDLVKAMQLHFHLLAETLAHLAERNPDKSMIKLHTSAGGFEVGCVMHARPVAAEKKEGF